MSIIFSHILPEIEQWPIRKFSVGRAEFIKELNQVVLQKLLKKHNGTLEELINKTIYLEKLRVKNNPWKVDPADDKALWNNLSQEVNQALARTDKDEALKEILYRIINRYNEEIVGGFKKRTFRFARRFLTVFFKTIYNKFNDKSQRIFWGKRKNLLEKIHVGGYVEETRALFQKGTVVLVPTHFSNLDSIMLGYALDMAAGMPAFAYGAGLNLYDAELPAYFMNRLGAYRVDRRKKNPIYLECLISMASQSLHHKVNNIFFPGGTRSRSGAMEEKLKLGLLGSVIDAQREIITKEKDNKIFVVPVILGYHFTFEAKLLVEQHLRSIGKEKYTRARENKPKGFSFKWLKKFFSEKSEFYLTFGEPMDVLGNFIDEEGDSLDKHCRHVDLKDYFSLDGEISENNQREAVYAKLLGKKVLESYFRNNLILTSHIISYVAFRMFQYNHKHLDLFGVLRMLSSEFELDYDYFRTVLSHVVEVLKEEEQKGEIRLHRKLHGDIDELIFDGLQFLGAYHTQKSLFIKGDTLKSGNIRLLYYYHNRCDGYHFENIVFDAIEVNGVS